jgi:hypothetical protein
LVKPLKMNWSSWTTYPSSVSSNAEEAKAKRAVWISMETRAVVLPPELDARTVYSVAAWAALGVPEMAPLEACRARPSGNSGVTVKLAADPLQEGLFSNTVAPA